MLLVFRFVSFFFFNDTATTEIYTLSLHDALPIFQQAARGGDLRVEVAQDVGAEGGRRLGGEGGDRKSTRLNSSHSQISYAVFCLKKKKKNHEPTRPRLHRHRTPDDSIQHTTVSHA